MARAIDVVVILVIVSIPCGLGQQTDSEVSCDAASEVTGCGAALGEPGAVPDVVGMLQGKLFVGGQVEPPADQGVRDLRIVPGQEMVLPVLVEMVAGLVENKAAKATEDTLVKSSDTGCADKNTMCGQYGKYCGYSWFRVGNVVLTMAPGGDCDKTCGTCPGDCFDAYSTCQRYGDYYCNRGVTLGGQPYEDACRKTCGACTKIAAVTTTTTPPPGVCADKNTMCGHFGQACGYSRVTVGNVVLAMTPGGDCDKTCGTCTGDCFDAQASTCQSYGDNYCNTRLTIDKQPYKDACRKTCGVC